MQKNYKPGDPVFAQVVKEGEGYFLKAEPTAPVSRPVVSAMIRPYLSSYKNSDKTRSFRWKN